MPSEMPVKFGLEALKVQAIASRSYALRCLASTGYAEFGAHVDDSTASQVYNSISEQSISVQAVNETRGLAAFYEGQVIDARFFQLPADIPLTTMKYGATTIKTSRARKFLIWYQNLNFQAAYPIFITRKISGLS